MPGGSGGGSGTPPERERAGVHDCRSGGCGCRAGRSPVGRSTPPLGITQRTRPGCAGGLRCVFAALCVRGCPGSPSPPMPPARGCPLVSLHPGASRWRILTGRHLGVRLAPVSQRVAGHRQALPAACLLLVVQKPRPGFDSPVDLLPGGALRCVSRKAPGGAFWGHRDAFLGRFVAATPITEHRKPLSGSQSRSEGLCCPAGSRFVRSR